MSDSNGVPSPESVHPDLAQIVEFATPRLGHDAPLWPICFMEPQQIRAYEKDDALTALPIDKHTLKISKAYGVAPYVGHPFVYMWKVATDELGRSIAGRSWIQYLPDDLQMVPYPDWRD